MSRGAMYGGAGRGAMYGRTSVGFSSPSVVPYGAPMGGAYGNADSADTAPDATFPQQINGLVAYMRRSNGASDASFATSLNSAPGWAKSPARNTTGAWLRVAVAATAANRVDFYKQRQQTGRTENDWLTWLKNSLNESPRQRVTAVLTMSAAATAAFSAGSNLLTYVPAGSIAQWAVQTFAEPLSGVPTTRSASPDAIRAVYDYGIARLSALNANAAVAYLRNLRAMSIPEDISGIPSFSGENGDGTKRNKTLLGWFANASIKSAWQGLPTWGKVLVVVGGVGLAASTVAPYAKTAATLAGAAREGSKRRRERRKRFREATKRGTENAKRRRR